MSEIIININKAIHKKEYALLGWDNGEEMMKRLKKNKVRFQKIESKFDHIIIKIPKRIFTINKSYFLGAFGEILERVGQDNFLDKYYFDTNKYNLEKIKEYVESSKLKASQEEILFS